MSQWQNTTAMHACAYIQVKDSQVSNCSMCPLWTWTTAFNRGRHWSTIRIGQQVHLLESEDMKLQISLSDLSHRTAGYSCQLFNISGSFAGPRVVILTAYQFSYTQAADAWWINSQISWYILRQMWLQTQFRVNLKIHLHFSCKNIMKANIFSSIRQSYDIFQ